MSLPRQFATGSQISVGTCITAILLQVVIMECERNINFVALRGMSLDAEEVQGHNHSACPFRARSSCYLLPSWQSVIHDFATINVLKL